MADSAIEARASRLPPPLASVYREDVHVPNVYPPVDAVLVNDDGVVWLRTRGVTIGVEYLRLDERGDVVATVNLPERATLAATAEDIIWVVERDTYDVESLVKYRVRRPG